MPVAVYRNRLDFVRKYVAGKDVVDVGSAELVGTVNREKLARWPFHVIRQSATSVVGVEKDPEQVAALQAAGYDVVGLSPDKPEKLARFRDAEGLTFPLLSDVSKEVLTAYGAYGEKSLYGKTVVGVIRSTFVLDEGGVVERASYAVKAKGHVAKLRRDLSVD